MSAVVGGQTTQNLLGGPKAPTPTPPPPAPTLEDSSIAAAAAEERRRRMDRGRASTILMSGSDTGVGVGGRQTLGAAG